MTAGLALGCAEFSDQPEEESVTQVPLSCKSNVTDTTTYFFWELTVDAAEPIQAGKMFTVTLGGAIVVPAINIDAGQTLIAGGFHEVNVVDGKATVHVRSGAVGADQVLRIAPIPYVCAIGETECDPDHDLEGTPGLRGNSDCQPESDFNPCARMLPIPTSSDCDPGGLCDSLGKSGQCMVNTFCVTGGVRVPLEEITAQYVAEADATEVLFGWDEGTWDLDEDRCWSTPELHHAPFEAYEEPMGPNAFRITAPVFPVAMECTMGIASERCITGESDEGARWAPDSRLVALPIE